MELAKSLVENIDFGDAERVWERFRPEPCDELLEIDEPTIIQEEKPQFIQKQEVPPKFASEPRGHYVQALLFLP